MISSHTTRDIHDIILHPSDSVLVPNGMYEKGIFQKDCFSLQVKRSRVNIKTRYLIIQIYSVKNFFSKNVDQREAQFTHSVTEILGNIVRRYPSRT